MGFAGNTEEIRRGVEDVMVRQNVRLLYLLLSDSHFLPPLLSLEASDLMLTIMENGYEVAQKYNFR